MAILDSLFGKNKSPNTSNLGAGTSPETIVPILPNEIYETAKLQLQDTIAPSAIEIGSKELKIGGKISRSFFIMSYPRFLVDGWLSPIINMDKIFDIAIHIHPIQTDKILKQFQKKVAEVQSQIYVREQKGLVRDPLLDTAYRDLEQLRESLQQAQERVFEVGLYVTIYADNEN